MIDFFIHSNSSRNELNIEILNGIDLIETLIGLSGVPRKILEDIIPAELFDQSDYILTIANSV